MADSIYILCIEASTEVCSVALSSNGQLQAVIEKKDNQHVKNLIPYIQQLLVQTSISLNELKAVAVSEGPGSYTSLRTGLATAKGLCIALNLPLILIPTLQAIFDFSKHQIPYQDFYISLLDARRENAYVAVYDQNGLCVQESSFLQMETDKPVWLDKIYGNLLVTGNASAKWQVHYPLFVAQSLYLECSAVHMCRLADEKFHKKDFSNVAKAVPNYINAIKITQAKK